MQILKLDFTQKIKRTLLISVRTHIHNTLFSIIGEEIVVSIVGARAFWLTVGDRADVATSAVEPGEYLKKLIF